MKKIGVLNKDLSDVMAGMGHNDMLVVGDAGLPIPANIRRIDLAIKAGLPGFIETVDAISSELEVDTIIIAEEMGKVSPKIEKELITIFKDAKIQRVSHNQLKELSRSAVAIVRTGEFTPFANVILVSGVVF